MLSAASRSAKAKVEALRSGAAPDAVAAGSAGAAGTAKASRAPGAVAPQAPDAEAGINEVDKTAVLPAISDKIKDES